VMDGELAELLESPAGQALLQFDEVSFNTLNKPVGSSVERVNEIG